VDSLVAEGGRQFLGQGLLGIIVLALGWVAWQYNQELKARYEQIVALTKAYGEIVAANAVALNAHNTETATRTRAIEAQAQQAQAQALATAELARTVERLMDDVAELRRLVAERPPG
jgi:regulator of protease activity HflC (stomatin/prohibitin superfamily)